MSALESFRDKFRLSELVVTETQYWCISLRPAQVTPASLVLSLKRSCESLAELTVAESGDLQHCFGLIETTICKPFKPTKFNYLALMMVDPHVHFHVIPRYEAPVRVNDELVSDSHWPGPPDVTTSIALDEAQLLALLRQSL